MKIDFMTTGKYVWVYTACDCTIGVYSHKERAETFGKQAALDLFGVEGTIEEFQIDA